MNNVAKKFIGIWLLLSSFFFSGLLMSADQANLVNLQRQVEEKVALYSGYTGTCPAVNPCGAICCCIVCPLCVLCILGDVAAEICNTPNGRIHRLRGKIHEALNEWKNAVQKVNTGYPFGIYNAYLQQIKDTVSGTGCCSATVPLFQSESSFQGFLILGPNSFQAAPYMAPPGNAK